MIDDFTGDPVAKHTHTHTKQSHFTDTNYQCVCVLVVVALVFAVIKRTPSENIEHTIFTVVPSCRTRTLLC